jgi:hypothetical protein
MDLDERLIPTIMEHEGIAGYPRLHKSHIHRKRAYPPTLTLLAQVARSHTMANYGCPLASLTCLWIISLRNVPISNRYKICRILPTVSVV